MLTEFATWYASQMGSLLPASLWRAGAQQDARIIAIDRLDLDPLSTRLSGAILLRRDSHETEIATLNLDHPDLVTPSPRLATGLRLPQDTVLCREVVLPLVPTRDLKSVIGFEMDRLTPFAAQELYWGVSNLQPDKASGRIRLNLSFVLRAQVDNLRQSLKRLGLNPSFIESRQGRINLDADKPPARRLVRYGPAMACIVLALACIASPFARQQMQLSAAAQAIAAATPSARAAMSLRRELEVAVSGQAAIAQARRAGDALQVLADLTNALPDDTWLSDLLFKSGDLTFDGRSANAAGLISRLSAIPELKNPSFTAPVTRAADGNDQFSMDATVQQ